MDEKQLREGVYFAVALNCEGVSELDLSRAFLAAVQNMAVDVDSFPKPFANLFEADGRMHEETKLAFMAYVDRYFETA